MSNIKTIDSVTSYFVYILECGDGSWYTGITTDVARRFAQHQAGVGGRYTRMKGVVRVLYTETQASRSLALRREAEIKKWSKERKQAFVQEVSKNGARV